MLDKPVSMCFFKKCYRSLDCNYVRIWQTYDAIERSDIRMTEFGELDIPEA